TAYGDREENVLQYRGSVAGYLLQRQSIRSGQKETRRFCRADDRARLHRETGPPVVRVVSAGKKITIGGSDRIQPRLTLIQDRPAGRWDALYICQPICDSLTGKL